jgi:hypothetical protein
MNGRLAPIAALAGVLFCASAFAANVLVNPGFETGSLAPWFADVGAPTVSNADPHTGSFSAAAFGGDSIRQNFAAIPNGNITEVSVWIKRPPFQFSQYSFYYSDNTSSTHLIQGNSSNYDQFNLTSNLTPGKSLTGFSIFGTSAGPAFLDDFVIDVIPEPTGAALALTAIVGAAVRPRRRRNA